MKKLSAFLGMFLMSAIAQAKTIHVPEDIATIAMAVQSAADGDTILLAPGTYPQSGLLNVNKAITIASRFLLTSDNRDIENTVISAADRSMAEWVELSAKDSRVIGVTFLGSNEHTLNITSSYASVLNCRFLGGKDQLSISGGGGYIGNCYFENAGDDGIDCDDSISWVVENNTIVNAHEDGLEVRLHKKGAPMTTHIFRNNKVIGSGQSGLQMIDYQGNSYREFYIHNNIFMSCKGSGVSCMYQEKDNTNEVYRGSLMEERAFVYNNTFDACNYGLTIAPHLLILNNIFANLKTQGIERGIYVTDDVDHSIVDYCLFYNNPRHFDSDIKRGPRILVDQNPQFNQAHELQEGSPCIDAGIARYLWDNGVFTVPTTNYRGTAPDLGAKEYGLSRLVTAIFSHIAVGQGFTTVFTLMNTGSTPVEGELILTGQDGRPLSVTFADPAAVAKAPAYGEVLASSAALTIPPGGVRFISAAPSSANEPLKSGWARLESTGGKPTGVATFQLTSGGKISTIAGVLASETVENATIPVDDDIPANRYTGYAVANPGSETISIKVVTVKEDGTAGPTLEAITLLPGQQKAQFLIQDPAASQKFKGSVVLVGQNSKKFSVVALVQNQGLYTAIPVVAAKAAGIN